MCLLLFQDKQIHAFGKLHTCEPNVHKNDALKIMHELRETVITSDEPIPKLYNDATNSIKETGLELVIPIPSLNNSTSFLYGARNKSLDLKKTVYKSVSEIEIPLKFRDQILADYCDKDEKVLVFCTNNCRQAIANVTEFFIDGTFKTCPTPFTQIFSLHGDIGSTLDNTNVVPLVFALMTHRRQSSYFKLFSMIKSQLAKWNPIKVHSDFEMASMNALKMLFPNIVLKGCYFHWCKNINKKADKLGHSKVYAEKRIIGLTKALALLPSQHIMEGWQFIKALCAGNIEMSQFTKYVETFWLKKHSFDVISVFGERHRTNNVLEGYHSKLNKNINTSNKTLLRLLNKIMPYQGSGSITKQRKKKQITNDNMIMEIQIGLVSGSLSVGQALEQLRN